MAGEGSVYCCCTLTRTSSRKGCACSCSTVALPLSLIWSVDENTASTQPACTYRTQQMHIA